MDSFRRLFAQLGDEQTSAAGSRASSAPASTTAATDDDDRMQVDPVSHSRQAQDNDDNMPELLSGSDSSDSENEDGVVRPSSSSSATTSAYAQIQPADATPDRRPRVEDVIDDDDRNRRTPRTATPDPSAQADAAAEAGDRPVRPLPRAFSSTRRIPMAGSYVMQGVSFAIPRQDAAAQEQLVEPVAATPATPAQPPPTAAPQTPPQHNDNAAQDGQANAQEPPPWLSNLLGSIFGALAQSNVRSTAETPDTPASDQGDTQAQPAADGSRGGSMNFLFPDVGVAASATARRAPPGTQPQQPTAQNAPAPPPENGPQHEFTMADLRRLQETAMRALLGGQGANANAAQPGPQTVPVPVPVPVPFPFPFFGGFHDAPSEDPGQARRLIEGLEEVPPGLVKRYMTVEKATDGGTGACAVCFEGLDTDLEDGEGAVCSESHSGNAGMPIHATSSLLASNVPSEYYFPLALAFVAVLVLRAFAQGRRTTRDRDLHDRTVLVTGGFTPLGLTLLEALAERGARVIALTSTPGPAAALVSLIRQKTANDEIFAEECDLSSRTSIVEFARQMLARLDDKQSPARLDAIVFAHGYAYGGTNGERASFLLTTLLLPGLLVAPAERDIRLVYVVNPFYAAPSTSEGHRSRRMVILGHHLQRVLDALPAAPPVPVPDSVADAPPPQPQQEKGKSSNIAAVSVSPGISRTDTIAPFLRATHSGPHAFKNSGFLLYLVLQPLLHIFTKTPANAVQSVLHVLFVPRSAAKAEGEREETEVLVPGALYADCAVVPFPPAADFHSEEAGVKVWESLEQALKLWAKEEEEQAANGHAKEGGSARRRKNKDAKVRWADEHAPLVDEKEKEEVSGSQLTDL